MEIARRVLLGPVTALCCHSTGVFFAIGNTVFKAAHDFDALRTSHGAQSVGALPDGCVVTCLEACGEALVIAASADTLFALTWPEDGAPTAAHASNERTCAAASTCQRVACADGARLVKAVFDKRWSCLFAVASSGFILVVPITTPRLSASQATDTALLSTAGVVRVRAFDAGVLLAGDVLVSPGPTTAERTCAHLCFYGATYAGTVIEAAFDIPPCGGATHSRPHHVVDAVTRLKPLSRTIPAHRAGCAIFAVATVVAPTTMTHTGASSVFLATCSDDRSVAVFQCDAPGHGSEWTLMYRLQNATFARGRVFDVCLHLVAGDADVRGPALLCGVAGEDGTVQAFDLCQPEATTPILYRPFQHDGHGAWKVAFAPSSWTPSPSRTGESASSSSSVRWPSLVSAGFDGAVLRHFLTPPDRTQMPLPSLDLTRGRKGLLQVRCVGITADGLVVCSTAHELLFYAHVGSASSTGTTVTVPLPDVLRVALPQSEPQSAPSMPTTITHVGTPRTESDTKDAEGVFVVGMSDGSCVLVMVEMTHGKRTGMLSACTTLAEHGKWLAACSSSPLSPHVVSSHLDELIIVSDIERLDASTLTLRPRVMCRGGPGRALTALHFFSAHPIRSGSGVGSDDTAGQHGRAWWVLCGDKKGSVVGYGLSQIDPAAPPSSMPSVEPVFHLSLFPGGRSISAFAEHAVTSPAPACRVTPVVTVFAADGLYLNINPHQLAMTPASAAPSCPLRLPAKMTSVLAASGDAVVAQHATTVSVYRRACPSSEYCGAATGGCRASNPPRCGGGDCSDWVLVAVYENIKAPRLLMATIAPGLASHSYTVHCSDGATIESYACGRHVAAEPGSDSHVIHGRAISGKDFNACVFLGAPLNALLCAGEDTGLLVMNTQSGSLPLSHPTALYGPHHSNILALCELSNGAHTVDSVVTAAHRVVTVGGLATVVLWEWTADAGWSAKGVLTEEDAQDPSRSDRIPRFLAVCALDTQRFAVGGSDGTLRQYRLESAVDSGCSMALEASVILNPSATKPLLAVATVLGRPTGEDVHVHHICPSLIAGDTNGQVYAIATSAEVPPRRMSLLHVERSAVNALSQAHVTAVRRGAGPSKGSLAYLTQFVTLHDSGTAHVIRGEHGVDGSSLRRVATVHTGITPGRGVCWPCRSGPITLLSEEFVVSARWIDKVEEDDEGDLVVLRTYRPNVRCVSGLSVQKTRTEEETLVAVVGQGIEVVQQQQQ